MLKLNSSPHEKHSVQHIVVDFGADHSADSACFYVVGGVKCSTVVGISGI